MVKARLYSLVSTVSITERDVREGVFSGMASDIHITTHQSVSEMKKWLEISHIDYIKLGEK